MGKVKRATSLVMYWSGDQIVVDHYLEGRTFCLDLEAVRVLAALSDWTDEAELHTLFPGYTAESVRESVNTLKELGLVVTDETGYYDALVDAAWKHWGQEARYFHFVTKDAPYVTGQEEAAFLEELAAEAPPPTMKRYADAPRLYLPRAFLPMNAPFQEVLLERRTTRTFKQSPIPLRAFSTLLFYAFSPMYFVDAGLLGSLMMKTSASAGARHETEFYVGVLNVESVPRGLYHYCQENHSLELLNPEYSPEKAVRFAYDQEWVGETAFIVYVSARFERMMWKYRHSRAYRAILSNLGQFGQTFSLCATALGLAPFVTAALREHELEESLGLDGITESTMYMLACGVPTAPAGPQLHEEVNAVQFVSENFVQMYPAPASASARREGNSNAAD
ncbi:SagB family peptide dehydrogenase [Symbiobacterium terraclitae]|uniref:SagB family peptide dehydrogenase n=1 Tax=Symbiobacterium terraclitae TaxID=557451 RepID=UPI0035B548BD